ncbi:MAG: HEAT repeat domain-containing protein, partial [Planctomycetota bacterium]|nr:HEAT repeat domain-containing protein [Planctomycetota bacterium]
LKAFLKYSRAGVYATAETPSVSVEQEHRRLAAHLLGFSEHSGYDGVLSAAANGSRKWRDAEQGLAMTALGRRGAKDQISWLFRKALDRDIKKQARRSAVIALGMLLDSGNEDHVKRLTRLVRDSKRDNTQQNFGVMALANIGGPHAVDALIGLIDRKTFAAPNDRAFVYLALGVCGGPSKRAREYLLAKYDRARNRAELSALAMACGLARVGGAVPLTIARVEKTGPAAGGARPSGGPAGGVASGGRDESGNLLAWGLMALGLHGDPRAVPVIRKAFKRHAGAAIVRENAAIALCLIRRRAAAHELIEVLKKGGSRRAKSAIVTALGVLPDADEKTVTALVDVYKTDAMPDNVRAMAIVALGAIGDPRRVPFSAQLMRNYNYFIRSIILDEIASLL